jgi:hypothetical protein
LQAQQRTPFRLGELLLQKGQLTEEQLKQALQEQYWHKEGFWLNAIAGKFKNKRCNNLYIPARD